MRDHHGEPSHYRLITTDDPTRTLGQGEVRYFRTLVQAANAFVNAPAPPSKGLTVRREAC